MSIPPPFYYLEHFLQALDWIVQRHAHLLLPAEHQFIQHFIALDRASQALTVRLLLRRGTLFHCERLHYAEIGDCNALLQPLADLGWLQLDPLLTRDELAALLTVAELQQHLEVCGRWRKEQLVQQLQARHGDDQPRRLRQWLPGWRGSLCRLLVRELDDTLRLIYFGNRHQQWSEFVVAELGHVRREVLPPTAAGHAFASRDELECWRQLQHCREQLEQGEADIALPAGPLSNSWLEGRRSRVLLELGQLHERQGDLASALNCYAASSWPAARLRHIRTLERLQRPAEALQLAQQAAASPHNETELQQVQRLLPRLQRRCGLPPAVRPPAPALASLQLHLPAAPDGRVELAARDHLQQHSGGAVHYVENALLTGLAGLLLWPALYAPVPGAFFHPFHNGPADLLRPDFASRRAALLAQCLQQLDEPDWSEHLLQRHAEKNGLLNPLVNWQIVTRELLQQALHCIPPGHIRLFCLRLLRDLREHRSGLPDLVQFWPDAPAGQRWRMLEIKGPGDRLQDNQQGWLDYFARHAMPAAVVYVDWSTAP